LCFYECDTYGWNRDNLKIKPEVLAHINHYINNDLYIIIHNLKKTLKTITDEKQIQQIETCLRSANNVADYVKSISEFVEVKNES